MSDQLRWTPDRAQALALLHEHTESQSLRRHGYAVEAAMRAAAERGGGEIELWGLIGLIHDFDYERYPEAADHPQKGAEILRGRGYPDYVVRTVLSHADYSGVPRDDDCSKWLFAVDELAGFCMACAMVQPDKKIASVKVKSVKKKLKVKSFCAAVSREEIRAGATALELELDVVIDHVLGALRDISEDLGL